MRASPGFPPQIAVPCPHQRFLLPQLLTHIDELDAHIAATDTEIARRVDPQQAAIVLLDTIPGIDAIPIPLLAAF